MKKIHILYRYNYPPAALFNLHWSPLFYHADAIKAHGITVKFYNSFQHNDFFDADVIIQGMNAAYVFNDNKPIWITHGELSRHLSERHHNLVYCDGIDNSTLIYKDVLDNVSTYIKKYIPTNWDIYQEHKILSCIYKDFYHKKYNLEETWFSEKEKYEHEHFWVNAPYDEIIRNKDKIKMGWSLASAFNNFNSHNAEIQKILHQHFAHHPQPFEIFQIPINAISPPQKPNLHHRPYNIFCAFSDEIHKDRRVYGRKLLYEKALQQNYANSNISDQHFQRHEYYNILSNSKMVLTSFGKGEACYRDYETTWNGAGLVTKDCSHFNTWPNFYIPNETYLPLHWDLSNYDEVIDYFFSDIQASEQRVINAQNIIKTTFGDGGRNYICKFLMDL